MDETTAKCPHDNCERFIRLAEREKIKADFKKRGWLVEAIRMYFDNPDADERRQQKRRIK